MTAAGPDTAAGVIGVPAISGDPVRGVVVGVSPGASVVPAARPGGADRLLHAALAGYVLLLGGLMAVHGVRLTLDVAAIAVTLAGLLLVRARTNLTDRLPAPVRELQPLAALFLAYELMRGYTSAGVATVHSGDVAALERWLFLGALPTQVLQQRLHVPGEADLLAMAATLVYFLHFALPIAVGLLLRARRPVVFDQFMGGLILLSLAGFATYLVLPVAPPWHAAETGALLTASGEPAVTYLKVHGFTELAALVGLDGHAAFRLAIHEVNPNLVGAFPSLHAGYPVLAFLMLRRAFGRAAWVMLGYATIVWLSIVYLADHYVVDVIGGVVYALVAAGLATRLVRDSSRAQ